MFSRKLPRRLWIVALPVVLATAGVSAAHPQWVSELGLDFWNVPNLQQKIAHDRQLRLELDRIDATVMKRIGIKESIIQDLLANKVDLLEAAADFGALNRQHPATMSVVRMLYPASTEDESLCLNVLGFVDAFVKTKPSCEPTYRKLQADFARHRREGSLKLPAMTLAGEL